MSSKDKYHLSPQTASTPATSDDEMETSFNSFKPTTVEGLFNPLYDVAADSPDNESPRPGENGLKSTERIVPQIRVR